MMENKIGNGIWKKGIIVLGISVGIYLVFRFLLPLVIPFVIAGLVSILYYPLLRTCFSKKRIWIGKRKKYFLIFAVLFFYLFFLLIMIYLCRYLFGEGRSILLNLPFYQAKIIRLLEEGCTRLDLFLHCEDGVCFGYVEGVVGELGVDSIKKNLPKITTYSVRAAGKVFRFLFCFIITVMATFFMIQDYDEIRGKLLESQIGKNICGVITKCKDTLKVYWKAQGLIMLLDGILCTLSFLLINQPYAFLFGPLTAIIDALPIMGAGFVLIPYTVFMLFIGEYGKASILFLTYLICLLVRQITEPRMIGGQVGLKPLYTILSMYTGFQLFGFYGFFLGPVGFLIGKEIYTLFLAKIKE